MKSRRAPTILDIARAARVSRTTASAALSGGGRISKSTGEHVRAVAAELGYVANPTARHLRAGRKGAIGIYVAESLFGYAFYMEYVFGAAEVSRQDAFALTLISALSETALATAIAHVDGVIVADPIVGDPIVRQLLESGLPVISAERHLGQGAQPRVTIVTDYGLAERQLLDHLWDRGARQPALLTQSIEISFSAIMEDVYRRWCEGRGVRPRIRYLEHASDPDAVRGQAGTLLTEPDPPDAILAAADGIALSVLDAARELGHDVGADLLVASCTDSPAMRFVTPGITAIEAPPREIGRDSARVMLDVLRGEDMPSEIHRPEPTIALRGSTTGLVRAD
jgi:DNA-binding LacI/PurR family transcriptional regulator